MDKVTKGPQTWIAPMPALLIGGVVEDKPTFMTAAWVGIANGEPPMVSVAIRPARHTLKGIRENDQFSLNVPSVSQARVTDFCGIQSGARVDKVQKCGFTVFYGDLPMAPLIEECPINLECKVEQIIELPSHNLVLGRVVDVHVSDDCLTDGTIDFVKANPLVFLDNPTRKYCEIGKIAGEAFSIGKTT